MALGHYRHFLIWCKRLDFSFLQT